jgi:hypothetical protein
MTKDPRSSRHVVTNHRSSPKLNHRSASLTRLMDADATAIPRAWSSGVINATNQRYLVTAAGSPLAARAHTIGG